MSTPKINQSCVSFGDRMRFLRGARSKAVFARFIGVSPPLYFKWENGSIPGGDKLQLISSKCGTSVEWLLTGVENTAGHRLAESYKLQKISPDIVSEHKPDAHLEREIEVLRKELCDARAVIRDMAASLAALTVKRNSDVKETL